MLQNLPTVRSLVAYLLVLGCALSFLGEKPSSAVAEPQIASPALGRYVRIEHRGDRPGAIEIAEVQVFSGAANVASMGEASQSPGTSWFAELAIDGVENGNLYYNRSMAITPASVGAFWELAFPKPAAIEKLVLYCRPEAQVVGRMNGVWISVLNSERQVIWQTEMKKAPGGPAFRAEFPVTVLNAANNPALAAAELLAVPGLSGAEPTTTATWDAKAAGPAGVPALGFAGGRVESMPGTPGGFALVFGREAAPFKFTGSISGMTADAKAENGALRWQTGENANWKGAEAVLSSQPDGGLKLDVTVEWKTNKFGPAILDLKLGNPASPGGEWLRAARFEGTRYKDGKADGFLAPVTTRKPLIGGHPLREVAFESPALGGRRVLISQPTSPARATLVTEADNVTHLYLEPRLVKAGAKHTYSLAVRFPALPAPGEATASKASPVPKSRSLLQGQFTLGTAGDGSVAVEFASKPLLPKVCGAYTRDGVAVAFGEAAWQTAELVREYQPTDTPDDFGKLVFRAQNADIKVEQTATMGRQDSSGQFLACPYRIGTTVEAMRPGLSDFRLTAGLERYRMKLQAMQVDDWEETALRSKVISDKELLFELKPDKAINFAGTRVRLSSLIGGFEGQATAQSATAALSVPDVKPGEVLPVGKRYTLTLQAEVTSLNDYAGPMRVLHPGRRSPFFTLPEPAVVQVRVPAGAGKLSVAATDGESGAALPEQAALKPTGQSKGDFGPEDVYECRLERQRPGVSALVFTLTGADGKTETRTFEVAHIGQVTPAPKLLADLPDEELLDLTPVDTINCADPADAHPRLDFPGQSEVIDTCIGKARRIGERGALMLWEITLPPESINQPHLAVVEYPDDARRNMSLNIYETADQVPGEGARSMARGYRDGMGTGVQAGWPFPLSHQVRKTSLLW